MLMVIIMKMSILVIIVVLSVFIIVWVHSHPPGIRNVICGMTVR